ncbi:MAG: sterol desaturase family protein [Cyclobacteriaceae bacterium]|nr:sterol desaturase family protein [Cyclobacteriaceae bacterium]MDH4297212.1 sterol desaturase family protein [Cyclobacteriaceae bacterium]MDH5249188.1 sterol desaturase family protein [Cyclobacteriaceae bacterium]
MDVLNILRDEFFGFLGISGLIEIFKSGDYSTLLTYKGITSVIGPLIPFLLILEIVRGLIYNNFKLKDYKTIFFIHVFNRFVSRFITIAAVAYCIGLLEKYAILKTGFTWYWLIYGYIVWELAHFVYHYLAHKVRLLWCLHSTHHAPEGMNLSVSFAHFFLEGPYADVIRTSICIMLGVSPPLLFLIMFIDGTWGAFIHAGENLLKDGRLGFLNKIVLTPSHHRVHHARNPLYMDTNFCNLLNIWDRVFGTLQNEKEEVKVEYGITREINSNNFLDVYFGEIYSLWNDVKNAPGIRNKLLYILMPPGWSHTGNHKTARVVRQAYMEKKVISEG